MTVKAPKNVKVDIKKDIDVPNVVKDVIQKEIVVDPNKKIDHHSNLKKLRNFSQARIDYYDKNRLRYDDSTHRELIKEK